MPIYRQLIGDTLTPVTAFCKIQEGDWSFLFESVVGGERLGRYSFVGSGPFLRFQAFGNRVQIQTAETDGWDTEEFDHDDPLRLLEERSPHTARRACPACRASAAGRSATPATTPCATSSACRTRRRTTASLPDLCFALYDRMVIFDHINKTIAVVAHAHVDPARPRGQLRRGVPARRSPGRALAARRAPTCS